MLRNSLLALIFIFAVLYIFEIGIEGSPYILIFKIIPMILIIILALTTKTQHIKKYHTLIVIGLIFCTIGDYTLQWFIVGLSFFLIGHIFYISAFLTANEQNPPKVLLAILVAYGAIMAFVIAGGLFKDGDNVLAIAVMVYISVILTMGWTAWRTKSKLAIIGAISFIISDTVLAINRFTYDIPFSGEIIMITYYGAQLLIALSIAQYSAIRNKVIQ